MNLSNVKLVLKANDKERKKKKKQVNIIYFKRT